MSHVSLHLEAILGTADDPYCVTFSGYGHTATVRLEEP